MYTKLVVMMLAVSMTACTLGPDYERPEIDSPEDFRDPLNEGASIANADWWAIFQDPELNRIIGIALEENRDLRIATERIAEARARYGFSRAELYPHLDIAGAAQRGNQNEAFIPDSGIQENFFLGVVLAWELDLFGRIRRSNEAALEELFATEEARRAIYISLVADVGSTYFLLLDLDARREIARQTVAARHDSTELIRERFKQGTTPMLDVNQAEIEEADAAADLALYERQVTLAENLLSVLLGRNPGPVTRGAALEYQKMPEEVPAGLPSELLQRRPDVLAAEHRLAAQTARIGVAEALRWPSLSLTGSAGYFSDEASGLLDSDNGLFNISANLFQPLFNAGQNKRNVEIEEARTRQLALEYEQSILQAFREVDDALVSVRTYRDETAAREMQTAAARNASKLSRARYNGGVTSYLEVLDLERSLFDAQIARSVTRRSQLQAIVGLYKALGGGWAAEEEE